MSVNSAEEQKQEWPFLSDKGPVRVFPVFALTAIIVTNGGVS